MSLEICSIKITALALSLNDKREITISGQYNMLSPKGTTVAVQKFNSYDGLAIPFDHSLGKNFVSDLESAIEIEIGIQEAVKQLERK